MSVKYDKHSVAGTGRNIHDLTMHQHKVRSSLYAELPAQQWTDCANKYFFHDLTRICSDRLLLPVLMKTPVTQCSTSFLPNYLPFWLHDFLNDYRLILYQII